MIPSIRTFLLINLLLGVTLITSFAVIANLFLEHKEVQNYLDKQLAYKTATIQAFISSAATKPGELQDIQKKINNIGQLNILPEKFPEFEEVKFQVWNRNKQLILRTPQTPLTSPDSLNLGFNDRWIDNEAWRFFYSYDPDTGLSVITSERFELREALETHITRDSILIMLISYPFLGLLIWLIVERGLDSLKRIATEVRNRDPNYLDPVKVEYVPTEIKPMIDELNELLQRLGAALEREKRFAADAAHELRTPLAALKAHAQVAAKAATNEEREEALRKVLTGVDRSAHVIQQLLIFSKMVPEASHGELMSIDLGKQATDVIADIAPEAISKNTDIELVVDKDITPIIMGFPTAIHILIRNLVDNAIRYTPAGSSIRVLVQADEKNVFLKVIDNGPGIPEELRDRVFERFFRVLGNKSTGSGLGLGIVQQIVMLHGAEISLSTPASGMGLEVTVTFPRAWKTETAS